MATATQINPNPTTNSKTSSKSRARRATGPAKSRESRAGGRTAAAERAQAKARELHDTLTAQVQALTESGEWAAFLRLAGSFHAYSLSNLLLILAQAPDATAVAGFRAWQEKGRQVRKGEKSIKIRGFSTRKVTTTATGEDPETGEETTTKRATFPILSVFDVAQTDPIEGFEGPVYGETNPARHLHGEDPTGIYARVADHLAALGWTVTREPIEGDRNGYTTTDGTRRVVIDADLDPATAAETALHEAAHVVVHTDSEGRWGPADGEGGTYVEHRGRYECGAESAAYVLAGIAGLDTSAYSVGYVAGWTGGDVDAVRGAAEAVLRAVNALLPALDAQQAPNGSQEPAEASQGLQDAPEAQAVAWWGCPVGVLDGNACPNSPDCCADCCPCHGILTDDAADR